MRTRLKSFLLFALLGITSASFGQSATWTKDFNNESEVRNSTDYEIVVVLTDETFSATVESVDGDAADLVDGMSGFSTAWDNVLGSINAADITLSAANSVATIRIEQELAYYLIENDSIGFLIPAGSLTGTGVIQLPDSLIINNQETSVSFSGTLSGGVDESDIRNGDNTLILTLTNNKWGAADAAALSIVKSMFSVSGGSEFAGQVSALSVGDLGLNGSSDVLTIIFDEDDNFYIPATETVSVEARQTLLQYSEKYADSLATFDVSNEVPVIAISDSTITEYTIKHEAVSFLITLSGDIWEEPLDANFKDQISSGGAWDAIIRNDLTILRVNDTLIKVTTPIKLTYEISSNETVEISIDPINLANTTGANIDATGTKTIAASPAGLTPGGTFATTLSEGDLRTAPGYVIELSISEDTWIATISDPANRDALINSITSSPADAGFTALISAIIAEGDVVRSGDGTKVTIAVPVISDFDITQSIDLSFTDVLGTLFETTSTDLSTGVFTTIERIKPYIVITTDPPSPLLEPEVNDAILIVNLYEDTFNSTFNDGNFTFTPDPGVPTELKVDPSSAYTLIGDDSLRIGIRLDGNITVGFDFGLEIDANELPGTDNVENKPGNVIGVSALVLPVINSVSILNDSMKIGDYVEITIIIDKAGSDIDYTSGTVADRILTDFEQVSAFEYHAYFTVLEGTTEYFAGDDIPVTNLILNNMGYDGDSFTDLIEQANDPIDTDYPVVDLISFNNGEYKIGEQVTAVIHATEIGLKFDKDLTKINTIPLSAVNVTSNESGSGIYQLYYTVASTNPDLFSGDIAVDVVMKDSVGNENSVYQTISGTSPKIDAHYPVITSASVSTTGVKKPGDIIEIDILSTEIIHKLGAGSHVNNVSASGGGPGDGVINMVSNLDNTYTLTYTVGSEDDEVENPGEMEVLIILEDEFGNQTQITTLDLVVNNVEIVTSGPIAQIFGGGDVCPGESVEVFVTLSGEPPFALKIKENPTGTEVDHVAPTTNYSFIASPSGAGDFEYTVTEVIDNLGLTGTSSGVAHVERHPTPDVSITNTREQYQITEDSILLTANKGPGLFTGPGVVTSEKLFYPKVAGLSTAPHHTIYYDYTDTITGCTAQDIIIFEVVDAEANITFSDTKLCYNDPEMTVTGNNLSGEGGPGTFTLYEYLNGGHYYIPEGEGITGGTIADDNAVISPGSLEGGEYRVYYWYNYLDSIPSYIFETFTLEKIPEVEFLKPADHDILKSNSFEVCNDWGALELKTNLDASYPGIYTIGPDTMEYNINDDRWYFVPSTANTGYLTINYEVTSEGECTQSDSFSFYNYPVPTVDFNPLAICIPENGGPIEFENFTSDDDLVSEYRWEFDDLNSADRNTDTVYNNDNYVHRFSAPAQRNVSLEVLTTSGCIAKHSSLIDFGDRPVASFTWVSDCWLADDMVAIQNESTTETPWKDFHWDFYDIDGHDTILLTSVDSLANDNVVPLNTDYEFEEEGKYLIRLIVNNNLDCSDDTVRVISLKPTIPLMNSDEPYFDDLDDYLTDDPRKWSEEAESGYGTSVWKQGEINHEFALDDGMPSDENIGWYTDLIYKQPTRSWIQSPCFDFSGTERPMIRLNIAGSFESYRDGAVLQYTLNDGVDWTTLGNTTDGINWYNSFEIIETPGGGNGTSIGWSGDVDGVDEEWVTAAFDLDDLIDQSGVIFGLFYATSGSVKEYNEGFAADNIYIGERTKRALIEHFTNSGSANAISADDAIDNFTSANSLDVTNLQYHMHYPFEDPMNENNSSPGSSRAFYYGVSQVPYALMDGGTDATYKYDFSPSTPTAISLKELTLDVPLFAMDITYKLHASRLATKVEVKALSDIDSTDVILYVAVIEKTMDKFTEIINGDTEFKNVVMALLPSTAGQLYSRGWGIDETVSEQYSWTYKGEEDKSELMVVAFLQDRQTNKVLQVTSNDVPEFGVGEVLHQLDAIHIYPNPARDLLYVEFAEATTGEGIIEITDMTGRVVMISEIYDREGVIKLDISLLLDGSYILQIKENGNIRSRTNFIKVR